MRKEKPVVFLYSVQFARTHTRVHTFTRTFEIIHLQYTHTHTLTHPHTFVLCFIRGLVVLRHNIGFSLAQTNFQIQAFCFQQWQSYSFSSMFILDVAT